MPRIIMGVVAGIGLGFILGNITSKKDKLESQEKKKPKSIDENEKSRENPYFSEKEMPKSIKDYYKKNK